MSKKTHKMAMMKEEAKAKKPAKDTGVVKKKPQAAGSRPVTSKPAASKGAVRAFDRPASKAIPPANLLTVRIVALVVAAIALAGGIYWIIQVQGNATAPVVIGLIALGFVAGLGIFSAVRAEEVVKRARSAMQRQ